MQINRKNKIMSSQNISNESHIRYNFDYNTLSLFVAYILCDNGNIRKTDYFRLKDLFSQMDMTVFEADPSRQQLISLINKGLEARLDKGLNKKELIYSYMKGGILEENEVNELDEITNLNENEITYIRDNVSNALNCALVQNNMEEMKRLVTKYDMGDYTTKAGMVEEIETFNENLHSKFKNNRPVLENDNVFSFDKDCVEDNISKLYDKMQRPSRFLRSQMVGLNIMLGGGLESTRFYLFLGNAGVGKSLSMINFALQIKRENLRYTPKNPKRRPVMLFLTQENTIEETVERIFQIISGDRSMTKYTKEEVLEIILKDGCMEIDEESNIGLEIVYRPDRSINTADLRNMIDEYENNGKEVICVFQDHIKRIRSVEGIQDLRQELGMVVNEMKSIAIDYNIPVISVSHLNRDAAKIIDDNASSNAIDLTRMLGRSNVSESFLMIDNADAVVIIGKELDENNQEYLAFNLIKLRYAKEKLSFMMYPLNGLQIMTDTNLETPIYKETLRPDARPINGVSAYTQNSASIFADNSNFKSIDDLADEEGFGLESETFSMNTPIKVTEMNIEVEDGEIKPIELVQWVS